MSELIINFTITWVISFVIFVCTSVVSQTMRENHSGFDKAEFISTLTELNLAVGVFMFIYIIVYGG